MQELLQHIDRDYYRSARLLIVRAVIARLRQQPAALPPVGLHGKTRAAGIPIANPVTGQRD